MGWSRGRCCRTYWFVFSSGASCIAVMMYLIVHVWCFLRYELVGVFLEVRAAWP